MTELFKTMTTAQAVKTLRKEYSDSDIISMSLSCSKGIYEAVSAIINKEVSSNRYSSEDREQMEEYTSE